MQGFKLNTAQVQSQKQVLSAQMQQLIKLLPLSATELQSCIQQEVEENPALEIPDFGSGLTLDEPSALSGDSDFWEDDSPPSGKGSSDSEISSDVYIDPRSTKVGKTLKQYLREQLDVENLSDEEKLCGEEIIQVDIAYHGCFQKINIFMFAVSVVAYIHVPGCTYQYRVDVDGSQQGSKQDTAVHTVDL